MLRIKKIKEESKSTDPDKLELPPSIMINVKQKKEITISFDMAVLNPPAEEDDSLIAIMQAQQRAEKAKQDSENQKAEVKAKGCCTIM